MFLKPPSYPLSDLSSTSPKTSLRFSPAIAPCRFEGGRKKKISFRATREAREKERRKETEKKERERERKYFSFGKEA